MRGGKRSRLRHERREGESLSAKALGTELADPGETTKGNLYGVSSQLRCAASFEEIGSGNQLGCFSKGVTGRRGRNQIKSGKIERMGARVRLACRDPVNAAGKEAAAGRGAESRGSRRQHEKNLENRLEQAVSEEESPVQYRQHESVEAFGLGSQVVQVHRSYASSAGTPRGCRSGVCLMSTRARCPSPRCRPPSFSNSSERRGSSRGKLRNLYD